MDLFQGIERTPTPVSRLTRSSGVFRWKVFDNRSYHLDIEPNLRERDEALARQADRDWWLDYRIRSGVEGTPSELKRTHGMRKLRVRGGSRVALAIALKITACNIKRWLKAAVALERAVLGPDAVTSGHECVITLCGRTREGNARHESDEQPGSLAA